MTPQEIKDIIQLIGVPTTILFYVLFVSYKGQVKMVEAISSMKEAFLTLSVTIQKAVDKLEQGGNKKC